MTRSWTSNSCHYELGDGYQAATLPLAPFGKARPRVTVKGTYMPAAYEQARHALRTLFGSVVVRPPWRVRVTAIHKMPASWSKKKRAESNGKWCTSKPDIDNCIGGVMDAIFDEDAAVVSVAGLKRWGEQAALKVEIWTAGRPDIELWEVNADERAIDGNELLAGLE